ncbi:MAG: ester cyclase [Cyanobacteria bacterium P01_H01_bin.15]
MTIANTIPVQVPTVPITFGAKEATGEESLSTLAVNMWAGDSNIDTSIFAEGYLNYQAPLAAGGAGEIDLDTWIKIVEGVHLAFPDLQIEILGQVAQGNRVWTHWRAFGTHAGEYLGQAATGNAIDYSGVQIDNIVDGRIIASWVYWDNYTLRRQIGLESTN